MTVSSQLPDTVTHPRQSVAPHAYFMVSAVFHYLGPAFAVLLFAVIEPLGVAWIRIVSAAAVFAVWRRPWRRWAQVAPGTRRVLLAWGTLLALMNCSFYLAIDRLPLGTVAAIEFLPVIGIAAVAMRSGRNVVALSLAVIGVWLVTDVHLDGAALGLAFAVVNAGLFGGYIVLAHRVSRDPAVDGLDGLALAMLIASVVALPIGIVQATPALTDAALMAAGVGVGVCSSVVPYVCDQLAMARLSRGTYALLVSILPATATVIGALVLLQVPSMFEVVGIALVVAGVAIHRDRAKTAHVRPSASSTAEEPACRPTGRGASQAP